VSSFRSLNGGPYSRVDTFYDSYGLVTKKDEYDWGASSYTRETQINYDRTLGRGIVDHPSNVKVYDAASNLKSETDYSYDDFAISGDTITCSPATKCRWQPHQDHKICERIHVFYNADDVQRHRYSCDQPGSQWSDDDTYLRHRFLQQRFSDPDSNNLRFDNADNLRRV